MPLMSKKDPLGIRRSGRMKFDKCETSDVRVRLYGNAAVVSGRLQRSRRLGARTAEDNWFFTKMYVRPRRPVAFSFVACVRRAGAMMAEFFPWTSAPVS